MMWYRGGGPSRPPGHPWSSSEVLSSCCSNIVGLGDGQEEPGWMAIAQAQALPSTVREVSNKCTFSGDSNSTQILATLLPGAIYSSWSTVLTQPAAKTQLLLQLPVGRNTALGLTLTFPVKTIIPPPLTKSVSNCHLHDPEQDMRTGRGQGGMEQTKGL